MTKQSIRRQQSVRGLPKPPGPYSWTATWGDMLFVSGLRGIDPATGFPAQTDEERVQLIFQHLAHALEEGGSSLRHVLSTRVYVTDMQRHRPMINEAYERNFGEDLPTRTIVEVHALNQDDTIELEAVAARVA